MKIFGMCINKNVVMGLAVVAGGVWWLAPGLFVAALPVLLLAICPLSMLLMMKAMNMGGQQQGEQQPGTAPSQQNETIPPRVQQPVLEVGEPSAETTRGVTAETAS